MFSEHMNYGLLRFFLSPVLLISVSALVFSFQVIPKQEKIYYPEDFTYYEGVEIYRPSQWDRNRHLRLIPGTEKGSAGRHYFGETARFTVGLAGTKMGSGNLTVQLLVNGENVGSFVFPQEPEESEIVNNKLVKEIREITIPQYSDIVLQLSGINGHAWAIDHITLIPDGEYRGEKILLTKPQTLTVYNTIEEQHAGHSMLEMFVQENVNKKVAARDSVLSQLRSPEEWREYQKQVRDKLPAILGKFPKKTPLNPRIVGRIDYPDYYIEKIIYESQPGYYIPANLYIPKNREFPLPGVLYTIGHWDLGKMAPDINKIGIGLAKKGYVVIIADPVGQGERSEYFHPETLEPVVGLSVDQHHYVGRPAFLADWSLPGLRTWDCIRAVDYLVSRPEVDTTRLAVAGNSGGGQMALLAAAVDKRIKVVAAAHPGGSCEGTYLSGRMPSNLDLFSLIPPRPCRMIVGDASGEEPAHRRKLDDMVKFYKGLGAGEEFWDLNIVKGVHDNSQPKRESTYEWLNKWFDKMEEGTEEPVLEAENAINLRCTESGVVLASLGGESGQSLNQKRGEEVYQQVNDLNELKKRISDRLMLKIPDYSTAPVVKQKESFESGDMSVVKFIYTSEGNIEIPSLLLRPVKQKEKRHLIVHVSEQGKPHDLVKSSLPFALVRAGYPVLSIDVRGTGETACHPPAGEVSIHSGYTAEQWIRDVAANDAISFNRTMTGMQTLDVLKGIDVLSEMITFEGKSVILIGEGLGGLWSLMGGIFYPEIETVITVNTLPSYKLLLSGKYYNQHEYFYIPGVLRDFDIPDLARLVSSGTSSQLWIDPLNEVSEPISETGTSNILGKVADLHVVTTLNGKTDEISKVITDFLNKAGQ